MSKPDFPKCNGYLLVERDGKWWVYGDDGPEGGPHASFAEAERAANELPTKRR